MTTEAIYVCPLDDVDQVVAKHTPSHMVTLINAEMQVATPAAIADDNHLRLTMHDICEPKDGYTAPSRDHIAALLAFGQDWLTPDQDGANTPAPMLIHCWAGISRSTAAAYILLCALNPDCHEQDIATRLRAASDTATPNPMMVRLADDLLGREGRMVAAIAAIGRGAWAAEGRVFSLPARLSVTGEAT